ncbi:hypothetical protein DL766_007162 [Monosporascus sp. MC13-8B]|nr:hypothetical protein DL763_000938 [Monosporascus cannonballus]RYP25069.1 hypothetical protein DL766_007162 [Monosporascus sp. MC13-8B]
MPPNQRERREGKRRLMEKYRIEFVGPIDSLNERDQARNHHRIIVSHIRRLGRTEFAQYHESVMADSNERPWRDQIRRRAKRIADLAQICRKGRKNELGWRLSLESEIMARFTVEVAWLWRSEQEVTPASANPSSTSLQPRNLKKRQEKRTPCVCQSDRHKEDPAEQGINPLFDDRADEAILYDEELRAQLPRREEKPDRVYGIRETKRLQRILGMEDRRFGAGGKLLEKTLRTTPFRADGEPILFPFLILEAKSEKGADSFTNIEVQTAFAIRELLMLQDELRLAAQQGDDWEGGPLVWFLSNKGEHWRVCIGYIDTKSSPPRFLVARLWEGSVDSTDDALRLLLIIDYICDWSRDIYRESVVQGLRSLVVGDSRSLAYDTDIFSLADRVNQWQHDGGDDQEGVSNTAGPQVDRDALRAFDTPHGAIRDIRYLRSRFVALYITEDNISLFLQSMQSQQESRTMAASLLHLFKGAWRVRRDGLDALELTWTGTDRDSSDMYPPDKKFLVVATISAYISPDWQQTLEVGYVAVAEDLLHVFLDIAGQQSRTGHELSNFPFVESDTFKTNFAFMRQHKPTDILLGCISRNCLSTTIRTRKRITSNDVRTVASVEETKEGITYRLDAAICPDLTGRTHDFVSTLYRRHKIGRQEPPSSVFRISSQLQKQGPLDCPPLAWEDALVAIPELPDNEKREILFAVSKNPPSAVTLAELCIFVTDPIAITSSSLAERIANSISPWQFQVGRFDHQPGWPRGRNKKDVIVREAGFSDSVESYLDSLKVCRFEDNEGSENLATRTWGAVEPNSRFDIVSAPGVAFTFLDALDFADSVPRRRMTSITWRNPQPGVSPISSSHGMKSVYLDRDKLGADIAGPSSNVPENPIPGLSGSGAARPRSERSGETRLLSSGRNGEGSRSKGKQRAKDGSPRTPPAGPLESGANASGNVVPDDVPSNQGNSNGRPVSQQTDSDHTAQAVMPDGAGSTSVALAKRSVIEIENSDSEGEPTITSPRKRARHNGGTTFSRDALDDAELDKLLRDGYFS